MTSIFLTIFTSIVLSQPNQQDPKLTKPHSAKKTRPGVSKGAELNPIIYHHGHSYSQIDTLSAQQNSIPILDSFGNVIYYMDTSTIQPTRKKVHQ